MPARAGMTKPGGSAMALRGWLEVTRQALGWLPFRATVL